MSKTGVLLVIMMVILGIYDLIAFTIGGEGTTVSAFMKEAGMDHPFVIFILGYISGHMFSFMPCPKCKKREINGYL